MEWRMGSSTATKKLRVREQSATLGGCPNPKKPQREKHDEPPLQPCNNAPAHEHAACSISVIETSHLAIKQYRAVTWIGVHIQFTIIVIKKAQKIYTMNYTMRNPLPNVLNSQYQASKNNKTDTNAAYTSLVCNACFPVFTIEVILFFSVCQRECGPVRWSTQSQPAHDAQPPKISMQPTWLNHSDPCL